MLRFGLLAVVLIIAGPSVASAQERYISAEVNLAGELVIATSAGKSIVVAKSREKVILSEQLSFEAIAVSIDQTAVGWLGHYQNCCTSYSIPLRLEVYFNGQRHAFEPTLPAWDWCFVDGGARVAALESTVHGTQHHILELWDVASGVKLETFTWLEDAQYPNAPAWAVAIDKQYSDAAGDSTRSPHRCVTRN